MKPKNLYIIISLLGCILCVWTCSPRAGENTTVIPQKKEYPQFKHIRFDYCDDCLSGEEIRKYEDSLGSNELRLNILEIAKAFKYEPYRSQDSSGNYNSVPMIGGNVNSKFHAYFVFERKVPELSPLRVAVLYSLNNPSSGLPNILYEVEWKFFFKDPVLEQYLDSQADFVEIDTGYVWHLYDTLLVRVANFFVVPDKALSSEARSGFFEIDQRMHWWLEPSEKIDFWGSKCPLDGRPYFFPDWHDHYRERTWNDLKYGFGLPNPGGMVSKGDLAMGWSSSPDYYHRTKWPPNSNIHWFDIKPTDLAIYLALTTGW